MCAATAAALPDAFEYVHSEITQLEHGSSARAANSLLNLAATYPTVRITAAKAHTPRVAPPHTLAGAGADGAPWSAPNLRWGTCPPPNGSTWFEDVRDGRRSCAADGSTVLSECSDRCNVALLRLLSAIHLRRPIFLIDVMMFQQHDGAVLRVGH